MTTSIVFTHADKIPVPSVFSAPVAQGDTLELSIGDDGKAVVYFSPELAGILSPSPGTSLTLSPGSKAAFTFQSSAPGAYSIVATRENDPAPARFSTVPSSHVKIDSSFHSENIAFPVDGGRAASNN